MKLSFLLVFLLLPFVQKAQVQIEFSLVSDSVIHTPFRINETDSLTKFKFYISHLEVKGENKHVSEKQHYLLDFHKNARASRIINLNNVDTSSILEIEFLLGVDHKTCNEGIGEGALDPINGMYWTWQSGYINFKMEGVSDNSTAKQNKFQLHLGGFRKPYSSTQKINLTLEKETSEIKICFDLNKFLNGVNLKNQNTIMSPSKESIMLSRLAKSCFYVD